MLDRLKTLDTRLLVRRCVGCGYDGALLRGGAARRCARCGCDLAQRPARSYAEMEDLLGQPFALEAPYPNSAPSAVDHSLKARHLHAYSGKGQADNILHRWLAFAFMAMVGFVAISLLMFAVWSSM